MNSKIYRCGYCGIPTDENANPLEDRCLEKAICITHCYGDNRTHKTNGRCCYDLAEAYRDYQYSLIDWDFSHL